MVEPRMGRWARVTVAVLAAGLLAGCGGGSATGDGRLDVVATTGMVGDAARVIGGDRVHVTTLMGPGVDPHLYKASAGDVERFGTADLILYNGLHLEAKLGEVLGDMRGRVQTVAVADVVPIERRLRPPEFEGAYDPHVWFDVSLWRKVTESVRDALIAGDPAGESAYRERADAYGRELDALHEEVRALAERVPAERRILVTAHDAFNYFGRAYGFDVRGLQGISTQSEAGAGDVKALAEFIVEKRIPAMFVESSVSPRAIEAVQRAVESRGFRVAIGGQLYSDALGSPGSGADTYVGMVRANVNTIVSALLGEATAEAP